MSNAHESFRERHQPSFLKALSRFGKLAPAARSSRISRDVVYEWLKTDEDFRQSYNNAIAVSKGIKRPDYRDIVWFFFSVVQDSIPLKLHPSIFASLNIAISQLDFKQGKGSTALALSRQKERFPSSSDNCMATVLDDGDPSLHQGKNGTFT